MRLEIAAGGAPSSIPSSNSFLYFLLYSLLRFPPLPPPPIPSSLAGGEGSGVSLGILRRSGFSLGAGGPGKPGTSK